MKKLFTVLLLTALTCSAANGYVRSDYSWLTYGDHDYAPTFVKGIWQVALDEALDIGGHLVTINSPEENAWLTTNFDGLEKEGPAGLGVWIGYHDVIGQSWHWESGESVTYTNHASFWGSPEPGVHAYLHTASHNPEPGTWNMNAWHDGPQNEGMWLHGIIEIPTVIPAPSAIVLGGIGVMLVGWIRRRIEHKS